MKGKSGGGGFKSGGGGFKSGGGGFKSGGGGFKSGGGGFKFGGLKKAITKGGGFFNKGPKPMKIPKGAKLPKGMKKPDMSQGVGYGAEGNYNVGGDYTPGYGDWSNNQAPGYGAYGPQRSGCGGCLSVIIFLFIAATILSFFMLRGVEESDIEGWIEDRVEELEQNIESSLPTPAQVDGNKGGEDVVLTPPEPQEPAAIPTPIPTPTPTPPPGGGKSPAPPPPSGGGK